MNCPVCQGALLVHRVAAGVTVPCRGGRHWVVSGTCPHRGCAERLFAWTSAPDEPPTLVTTGDGYLTWRTASRPPFVPKREMAPAFVVAMVMFAFIAMAVWAMWRTFELSPDLTSRVIFGVGPALVVFSQLGFAWLGIRESFAIRLRDELLVRNEVEHPGGLVLRPEPRSYRG